MIKDQIIKALQKVTENGKVHLEHPEDEKFGDFSTNLALQEKGKKNPREIAEEIVGRLKKDTELNKIISKIEVAGPGFINLSIKNDYLIKEAERVLRDKEKYGKTAWHQGETWLIEHTSPNPNKAMHLGHLRNNITGMAIANIWEFLGIKTIRDCVDNNRGIAIAKLMWGYLKFAHKQRKEVTDLDYWHQHQEEWLTPEDEKLRPDLFVDQLYVKASEDFKNNKETEKKVRQLVVDWENEDKKTWALWEKVLSYSYQGQEMTLKRLGNKWDRVWHEHEHYKQGKALVEMGLKKKVFKKLKTGVILSDLESYGLTDTVLIKSDETALYITQDLALTKLKKETFKSEKMFWVVGPEQSLALKQMFAICEQLDIGKLKDFTHIAFGYMSLKKEGKMSSRAGNVVYIDDLVDQAKEIVLTKIEKKPFSKSDLEKTIEEIALGAIKYSILKVRRMSDIAFDFKKSISLEGNSGPYLQYTCARALSVLRKFQAPNTKLQITPPAGGLKLQINREELAILGWLYRFPEVTGEAGRRYAPNLICNFLYELAQRYNSFYNKHRIIGSKNESLRLLVTKATAQILKNGLNLLGIKAPEKM